MESLTGTKLMADLLESGRTLCPRPDEYDEITMESSTESLGLEYQLTNKYNNLLPYADELNREASALLAEIKGQLGRAIALRKYFPDCYIMTTKLTAYIRLYSFRFTKEDHILFIKLYYELTVVADQDTDLLNLFAGVLALLLKKQRVLSPSDLQLPWRPLYDLKRRLTIISYTKGEMYKLVPRINNVISGIIYLSKPYFPLSATREILDEFRPYLCPLMPYTMGRAVGNLENFLPIQLAPEHHHLGFKLWFEEMMTIWETSHNEYGWLPGMMSMMGKLALKNIGYIDWEPYVPIMFTRILRSLNLPVHYRHVKGYKQHRTDVNGISCWITSVLGNNSSAQMHLEKFLKTIETYFYQANSGCWTERLKDLLHRIAFQFVERLHRERFPKPTWETRVPDSHKLTDADVDAFVKCIMPVALTAMFGHAGVDSAHSVFRSLAMIRPNLVIPEVIDRMFLTFDSLTEPHKLTASMSAVTAVARPLVQGSRHVCKGYGYSEGPSRVLPLLISSLPGIDSNDFAKTLSTFRLISVYTTMIPLVDCSHASTEELKEEDQLLCEDTAQLEDFVLQFFDRVFSLIESSTLDYVSQETSRDANNGKSRIEALIEIALGTTTRMLLFRTSNDIYLAALHKLRAFITERVLETKISGPLAATVCRSFAKINGRETLKALLPPLVEIAMELVREGVVKEDHPDSRFMYALLLIGDLVCARGEHLLPYIETLTELLDSIIHIHAKEGCDLVSKLIKNLLTSLCSISITSNFTYDGKDYNDPKYPYVLDWGKGTDIEDIDLHWYVPGEEEIAAVQMIFNRYLLVEMEKIREYIGRNTSMDSKRLAVSIGIISAILHGSVLFLPEPDDDSRQTELEISFSIGIKHEIKMPDGGNVRQAMVQLFTELQDTLLTISEDDTRSLKNLTQVWKILLLGRQINGDNHKRYADRVRVMGHEFRDDFAKKRRHLAQYILERAGVQHHLRMYMQCITVGRMDEQIMLQLFKLATSVYAGVRAVAQYALVCAGVFFPFMYKIFIPHIVELLDKDPEENHEALKGLLYFLIGHRDDPMVAIRDWEFRNAVWPALVRARPSEKLSIIKLKNTISDNIYRAPGVPIKLDFPDSAVRIARKLWTTSPRPSLAEPTDEEIEQRLEETKKELSDNEKNYDDLLESLLSATENNRHWRQKALGLTALGSIAYPERPYPPSVIRFFLEGLVNESLEVRMNSIPMVIAILRQRKREHKKIKIAPPEHPADAPPGIRPDNLWLQYNYETRPLSESRWNEQCYLHSPVIGFHAWPKEVEIYAPSSEQPGFGPDRVLSEPEQIIEDFFCNQQTMDKIIKYHSLEGRKGKDKFTEKRFQLFKSIFRNHGIKPLPYLIPHLQRLVSDNEESHHHCAAEIIAGAIRGSKHWPYDMVAEMWGQILPILRVALDTLSIETVRGWGACLQHATKLRDPNRQHWLMECLMEEPAEPNSTSSFVECQKIVMIHSALINQSWRVCQLNMKLLHRVEQRLLSNPFQNVRESLGNLLTLVFCTDWGRPNLTDFPTPNAQEFLKRVLPQILKLGEVDFANLKNLKQETRLAKTVFKWITAHAYSTEKGTMPSSARLLPLLCQLENYEGDDELKLACTRTIAALAQTPAHPPVITEILVELRKIFKTNFCSAKHSALCFLEVFVFHHMPIIIRSDEWLSTVMELVRDSLEDTRVEVREKASEVLGGLLHCDFITDQAPLLVEFKKKIDRKVELPEDWRFRHGGVLGLCAFIRAHPYDVPQYMPEIFEYLRLCLNDPQPIPSTIRKTLGDFKRTHYDGWSSYAQQFTEEQLAILQDLTVPPHYYA